MTEYSIKPRGYAALLRVSGRKQVKEETIEIQAQHIRLWCERRGINADSDVFWIRDKAVSGDVPLREREGGGQLLELAESGRITDGVIVYKINRAVREDLLGYLELELVCADNELTLYATQDSIDTSTKSGRTMARLRAVLADDEKRELVERLADAKRARARMGRWQTKAPYGWRIGEDKRLVLHPVHSQVLREIIRLVFQQPMSVYRIAEELKEQGIPSPTGLPYWEYSVISRILRNPILYGEGRYNQTQVVRRKGKKLRQIPRPDEEHISVNVEPLIDRVTFDRMQQILEVNARVRQHTGTIIADYWLNGLIKCSECGRTYNPQNARGQFPYYRHAHKNNGTCSFQRVQVPRDLIEQQVWQELVNASADPQGWKERAETEQPPRDAQRISQAEAAVKLAESKLTELEDSYFIRGTTNAERYDALAPRLVANLTLARRTLAEYQNIQRQHDEQADMRARVALELSRVHKVVEKLSQNGSIEDKRELARAIIRRVVVLKFWRVADSRYGTPHVDVRVEFRS